MNLNLHPDFGWLCRKTFDDKFILDEHIPILLQSIMPFTDDPLTIESCLATAIQSMKRTPSMGATMAVLERMLWGS